MAGEIQKYNVGCHVRVGARKGGAPELATANWPTTSMLVTGAVPVGII
jgi:hypothetical protein